MKKNLALNLIAAAVALGLGQSAFAVDCNRDGIDDGTSCSFGAPSGLGNIPFDLLPPGARSLGIGGAFTAVADDATAAEANPAGLTILTRPELSIHGRSTSFDVRNYNGDGFYADSYNGVAGVPPQFERLKDRTNAVSFASFVYPFSKGAVSLYYLNSAKAEARRHSEATDNGSFDLFQFDNQADVNIEALGLSGAYRLDDFITIGGSIRYSKLSLQALSANRVDFFFDFEQTPTGVNTTGITDTFIAARAVDDSDRDVTFNLGMMLNPGGRWSMGIVYKDGGSFDLNTVNFSQFTLIVPSRGINSVGAPQITPGTSHIDLPDVLNVGFAFRPSDEWLLALDVHHERFGQLPNLPGRSILFNQTAPGADANGVVKLGDRTSWHIGAERVFVFDKAMMGVQTLAVRAGAFTQPRNGGYKGTDSGSSNDNTHYTIGLGSNFGEHVQIDLAAEFSQFTDNVVLSGIYRF